jgi:hypothetical protein
MATLTLQFENLNSISSQPVKKKQLKNNNKTSVGRRIDNMKKVRIISVIKEKSTYHCFVISDNFNSFLVAVKPFH